MLDQELVSQIQQRRMAEADLLKKLLNFDSFVNDIEQALRNKSYDPNKSEWVEMGKPLINDKGISTIRGIIVGHINNVFILSNFDSSEVKDICLNLGMDIIDILTLNYSKWEIDVTNLGVIYTIIINNVYAMLKGSWKEGIRGLLKETEHRETVIREEGRQKRSLLPSFGRD